MHCRLFFVLCVLASALLAGGHAQTVLFNNSYDCGASGCYINDPAIYEGKVLPTSLDEVEFNVTTQLGITLVVPNNTVFNVSALSIFGTSVTLVVEPNSTLESTELSLHNVLVHLQVSGTIVAREEASIEASTVWAEGSFFGGDLSFENTALLAHNWTVFISDAFEFENGTLEFYEGSSFNSSESEFSDASIVFYIRPHLGEEADFERVDAFFPVGFFVESEYKITSSNFTAYLPDELANVTLELGGKNNLTLSNIIFAPNKLKFNNTGTPFMTFTVSNNASFNGTLDVPGEIVVTAGSSVVFNGSISLSGGIQANVDTSTHIRAYGTLSTGSPISLTGHNGTNDFTVDNAVLTTPSLTLEKFTLQAHAGTTIINGSVVNDGSVQLFGRSSVIVHGNYTQVRNATFELFDLEDTTNVSLSVNGTANITGDIKYNAAETKKKFTVVVLQAHSLHGKFETEAFTGDASDYSAKLDYSTPNQVKVVIDPEGTHELLGLYWWVWLIIAVGALTVIVAIVALVRVVKKRSQYQAVSSR